MPNTSDALSPPTTACLGAAKWIRPLQKSVVLVVLSPLTQLASQLRCATRRAGHKEKTVFALMAGTGVDTTCAGWWPRHCWSGETTLPYGETEGARPPCGPTSFHLYDTNSPCKSDKKHGHSSTRVRRQGAIANVDRCREYQTQP